MNIKDFTKDQKIRLCLWPEQTLPLPYTAKNGVSFWFSNPSIRTKNGLIHFSLENTNVVMKYQFLYCDEIGYSFSMNLGENIEEDLELMAIKINEIGIRFVKNKQLMG